MENKRPGLHVVIYYQSNSKFKTKLQKKLSAYAKKRSDDPYEPFIDISMDNSYFKKIKAAQKSLTCDTINVFKIKRPLKDAEQLCVFIKILLGLTLQKLFENTPDSAIENWMILYIIPSNTSDVYDIQWTLGK